MGNTPDNEKASLHERSSSSDVEDPQEYQRIQEESKQYAMELRGKRLSVALSFVSGTGFTLFGYDQGVMSALLTAPQFEQVFWPTVVSDEHPNRATLQSLLDAVYEIGCLIGALSCLYLGDKLRRRMTMVTGAGIMIIGAIIHTCFLLLTREMAWLDRVINRGIGQLLENAKLLMPTVLDLILGPYCLYSQPPL
ncbi:hypothetical protein MPER_05894 [Moniliophthora perniciosa FA553]|nr:hypothetical protein MPER_05894 [Moniliophthora perniciosa FA553]